MKKIYTITFMLFSLFAKASDGIFDFLNNNPGSSATMSVLIFYKPDCPYCQNMSNQLQTEKGFDSVLQPNFSIQKIDITTEGGKIMASRFNIHAVPAVIKFDIQSGDYITINGFPGVIKLAILLNLNYPTIVNQPLSTVSNIKDKPTAICGDGIKDVTEQCDDGNNTNGDGCGSACAIEAGYQCSGNPSTCITICGDGIKMGAEQCDDGNTVNGDGCSSTCMVQTGYSCSGNPSACTTICGDGIKTGGEQCDDGNTVNGDGCSSTCIIEPRKGVAINDAGLVPDISAMLDVTSNNKGVLIPRLTSAQRIAIPSAAIGLIVYDITTKSFWYYKNGTAGWTEIGVVTNVAFSAYLANSISMNANSVYPAISGEYYDYANNYNSTSSSFTVPVDGLYTFTTYANFSFSGATGANTVTLKIEDTGSTEYTSNSIILPASYSGVFSLNTTFNRKLTSGTVLRIKITETSTTGTQTMTLLNFSGYKVN